jgi:hypothetical protein
MVRSGAVSQAFLHDDGGEGMTRDDRDTLQVLKEELDFIEKGGYGRSVRTPRQPTSIFQDSRSCLNFGDPARTHPCGECLLIDFVPPEFRREEVPCHHIPLNAAGETVEELEQKQDQQGLEERMKAWLRAAINRIEEQSTAHTAL